MQTALLPQKISRQLDKLNCKYLWGDTTNHWPHTVSWETITTPKDAGDLGLKSTHHMNVALLMNQAWRLQQKSSMLWAQVLKAKCFPYTNLFENDINPRASHIRKALQVGIKWLRRGMKWILGDVQTIQVWEDHYKGIYMVRLCPMRNRC